MSRTDLYPWTVHTVGEPGTNECCPLVTLSHVTHVENALEIVRRGEITAGLVYDESALRDSRTTVVWLSPNDWGNAGGSRYGNVEFVLDWKSLLVGRNAYRIEVQDYSPRAFRILLAREDLSETYPVYDASTDPGPWRSDPANNTHFWNGQICLEIMLAESIPLEQVREVRFCKHHAQRCCIAPGACPDAGLLPAEGGGLFLAGMISRGIDPEYLPIIRSQTQGNGSLTWGWLHVLSCVNDPALVFSGNVTRQSAGALALAAAFLTTVYTRSIEDLVAIAAFFSTREELMEACATRIETYFGLTQPLIRL